MTITKLKEILQILEDNGLGEEFVEAEHDVIFLTSIDGFEKLPDDVKLKIAGKGEYGEKGFKEGMGPFVSEEYDCLACYV